MCACPPAPHAHAVAMPQPLDFIQRHIQIISEGKPAGVKDAAAELYIALKVQTYLVFTEIAGKVTVFL